MVISGESEKERRYIVHYSKDMAGRYTDESWNMIQCATFGELSDVVQNQVPADLICVDITMEGALEMVKTFRSLSPSAYIILIASPRISPLIYMRPTIGAESLMLKPLSSDQIREVMEEAIRTYAERFYKPDETRVFVIGTGGGRNLIDYEKIWYFESREKRVYLNAGSEEYGFYDTLEQLEQRLCGEFLRCHRSFLVKKDKIAQVYLSQNRIVLKNGMEVPLSRSCKPAIREYMQKEHSC